MKDQTILITGGTGTFGTEFARYALYHHAKRIIVLSRGEHRQAEFKRQFQDEPVECWIGDVRDKDRMAWAMRCQPDVVIHAAAMKRVEVCEVNPREAKLTNVDGTANVVEAAMLADVPRVLMISSDKATSPETTYGRTKAAAEDVALGQNAYRGDGRTRISVVRYGNVLGSQGSFLETLWRARQTGAPIGITDPDSTRFWWGIESAVQFVDTVLARMQGAEIWVPKLVSSKVTALASAVAPRSPHHVIGTRGPEKTHEAMISITEGRCCWVLPDCYVLLPKTGQWWSPPPPLGSVRAADGFSYTSNDAPLSVSLESLESPSEDQPCAYPV